MYCIARNIGAELNLADSGFNENTTELITGNYVSSANVSYTDTLTEGGGRVAVRVQYTYCHSYCVLHGYSDRGGGGGVGERVVVRVQYTYCHSYCILHGYSDRGGVGERVAVRVQYTYCHSYCVLHGYSDRGGVGEREWQYVYSTHTATVTVSYTDTLTEGGGGVGERVAVRVQYTYCHSYCVLHGYSDRGGGSRGESGSTCTVHVLPQLLCLTRML